MVAAVEKIGREFEFYRSKFNSEKQQPEAERTHSLDETDAALHTLYAMFGAQPAPVRVLHDGVAIIVLPDGDWREQYKYLWKFLVPGVGAARTVQGEVVRIVGRVGYEALNNGGANWGSDFKAMLKAFEAHLGSGAALDHSQFNEVQATIRKIVAARGHVDGKEIDVVTRAAVAWVAANPGPIALSAPGYRR